MLESIRYICDSARIAAAAELKTRKLLEEAHDDLDKMRGEVDAAIRDCYLALGMGENVAFRALRKAVADRLTKKATPEPVAPALDYKNSMRGQINAREHPDGAQRRATAPEPSTKPWIDETNRIKGWFNNQSVPLVAPSAWMNDAGEVTSNFNPPPSNTPDLVPRTERTFTLEQVEKAIITEGDGRIVNDGRTATDEWWRGFARWTCARLTAAPEPTNQEPA